MDAKMRKNKKVTTSKSCHLASRSFVTQKKTQAGTPFPFFAVIFSNAADNASISVGTAGGGVANFSVMPSVSGCSWRTPRV